MHQEPSFSFSSKLIVAAVFGILYRKKSAQGLQMPRNCSLSDKKPGSRTVRRLVSEISDMIGGDQGIGIYKI
jgi:hypothetical protein